MAVYKIFEKTYGEAEARTIIQYVEDVDTTVIGKLMDSKVAHLATREELRSEVRELRSEMKEEFKAVRSEMAEEFKAVHSEMKEEFKNVRNEMSEGFREVRNEMKDGFQQFRGEMKDIYATKKDLVNVELNLTKSINKAVKVSSIITGLLQLATIAASVFAIAKYMTK